MKLACSNYFFYLLMKWYIVILRVWEKIYSFGLSMKDIHTKVVMLCCNSSGELYPIPPATTRFGLFAECLGHSAKPILHLAKALPSATHGKEHSTKKPSAKSSLSSVFCWAHLAKFEPKKLVPSHLRQSCKSRYFSCKIHSYMDDGIWTHNLFLVYYLL